MTENFVFDTYALVELMKDSPAYLTYVDSDFIINSFIFAEFCYALIKHYPANPEALAEKSGLVKSKIVQPLPEVIAEAMQFRYVSRKKGFSMADCISYIQAQKLGIPFLTGDRAFEGMPGVEFVK